MEYIEPLTAEERITDNDTEWFVTYPLYLPNPLFVYPITYTVYYPPIGHEGSKSQQVSYEIKLSSTKLTDKIVKDYNFDSNSIWVVVAYEIDGIKQNVQEIPVGYYAFYSKNMGKDYTWQNNQIQSGTYFMLSEEALQKYGISPQNPYEKKTTNFNGSNWFEWLAETGENILINSGLIDVLTYDIGGYTIISLITLLFPIYMGWCIIKFAIP